MDSSKEHWGGSVSRSSRLNLKSETYMSESKNVTAARRAVAKGCEMFMQRESWLRARRKNEHQTGMGNSAYGTGTTIPGCIYRR